MTCHRVDFHYKRTVSVYIEAEEDEIIEFLEDNEEWHPLKDAPELVEIDTTDFDWGEDCTIVPEPRFSAICKIVEGELVELDS